MRATVRVYLPVALCALSVLCTDTLATDDPIALLRNRTLTPLLPNKDHLPSAIAAAQEALVNLTSDGSWRDLNYSDVSHGARDHWGPITHLMRLRSMAIPLVQCNVSVSFNPLCKNQTLNSHVQAALEYWLVRNPCSENWWFNQIDAPTILGQILLLLQHGTLLPQDKLVAADVDVARGALWWRGWSGYNLVSLASLQVYRGLLFNDASMISEGFSAVWTQLETMPWPPPAPSKTGAATCNSSSMASSPCIPRSCQIGGGSYLGDGIQRDGSFHQHGAQLLDGAYGQGLTEAIINFLPLAQGLPWTPSSKQLLAFATHVQVQYTMTVPAPKPVWDWQVCGRGCLCSGNVAGLSLPSHLLRDAAKLYPSQSEAAEVFAAFADEIDGKSTYLADTKSFWRSDYLIHRRDGWIASWKGRSNRTIAARCVNSDSKMSADTGEGATMVYRLDEHGTAHQAIWPVINWQQFPGITCRQQDLQPCEWQYNYDDYPTFVGSIAFNNIGGAAQQLGNHGMKALRSWLFSETTVTSIVSAMSVADSGAPVLTTVANQRLQGAVQVLFSNNSVSELPQGNHTFDIAAVQRVYHNSTTYNLVQSGGVAGVLYIENGVRSGDYSRISSIPKAAQASVFRVSFEHANTGMNGLSEFQYTVQPGATLSNKAAHIQTDISASSHLISDLDSCKFAMTFWKPSLLTTPPCRESPSVHVQASAPVLLLLQPAANGSSVSVSNPDNTALTVNITLQGLRFRTSSGCTSIGNVLTFDLPADDLAGQTRTCIVNY